MTFVSPEITHDKFCLYIETHNETRLLSSGKRIPVQANNTACITSFEIKPLNKSCLFVGRKSEYSKILCTSTLLSDLQTYQELETYGTVGVRNYEFSSHSDEFPPSKVFLQTLLLGSFVMKSILNERKANDLPISTFLIPLAFG